MGSNHGGSLKSGAVCWIAPMKGFQELRGVKRDVLSMASEKPSRYTDFITTLKRPNKTIYAALAELQDRKLIVKNEEGLYVPTQDGLKQLSRESFIDKLKLAILPGDPSRVFRLNPETTPIESGLITIQDALFSAHWRDNDRLKARIKELLRLYADSL